MGLEGLNAERQGRETNPFNLKKKTPGKTQENHYFPCNLGQIKSFPGLEFFSMIQSLTTT